MAKKILQIDGARFDDLDGFWDEVSARLLADGIFWGRNLDAFNDVLRGGFGTPERGFILEWMNSDLSRQRLGHDAMARRLRRVLERCHPTNRDRVRGELAAAERGEGPTLFELLVEIIREHGEGGQEAQDEVELLLR